MPGITGIIGSTSEINKDLLSKKMLSSMLYERFYRVGFHYDDHASILIGWTYFEDENIEMPLWNERRDKYLIYTGNIIISKDEINWLKEKNHRLRPDNKDYLIHLYEEFQEAFFEIINGQYSGVLVDLQKNISYIFNDRYGLGRIYYREIDDRIIFSTEAKSILSAFSDSREIDPTALAEMLVCGCTLRNRCLYRNISILQAGTILKIEAGRRKIFLVRKHNDIYNRINNSAEDYYQRIKTTLVKILPRYFEMNDSIGISITGGKDSRIILAYIDVNKYKISAYTFNGFYRENRDVKIGRLISRVCGIPHYIIKIEQDFFRLFPYLAAKTVFISDGLMDVTGAVDLYVNGKARNISPVRLTGNYGQEVLEGSVAFKPSMISLRYINPDYSRLIKEAYVRYFEETNLCDRTYFILIKQLPWYHYNRYKLESSQLKIISPFLDNELIKILESFSFISKKNWNTLRLKLLCDGNPYLAKIETDMGYSCKKVPVLTNLNKLYQSLTYKAEYAFNHGMPSWLAKLNYYLKAFHLENIFLGRHKFYHYRVWYANELSNYVKDMLLDNRSLNRNHINKKRIEKMVNRHLNGMENHTMEITQLLTIELIFRKLLEGTD